jgi:hypothetical protein
MGYKHVVLHVDDTKKLIANRDWTTYRHINDYIKDMADFGLRPYKKDIRPSFSGSGVGDPKMNHFCIKHKKVVDSRYEYFRYIIINQKKWMLTKLEYDI